MIPTYTTTRKSEGSTTYSFLQENDLPDNAKINAALSFAFIGENLVVVKKQNGWWDIIGGKLEDGESWIDCLKREAREEAGVTIENYKTIGYMQAENSYDEVGSRFDQVNYMPITISFVQQLDCDWLPKETLSRDALHQDEVRKLFSQREDNAQLLKLFNYVFDIYRSQGFTYTFEYLPRKDELSVPNTQSATFVKNTDGMYLVVQEREPGKISIPGGGCHMDESNVNCAIREIAEEAFVSVRDIELLGVILVKIHLNGTLWSVSKQSRFIALLDKKLPFPKNTVETSGREWVPFSDLSKKVRSLQNTTGVSVLDHLGSL